MHIRFRSAREATGLTIKEVASRMKVPQYRLNAIEKGNLSEFKADVLQKYAEFLDLTKWLDKWAATNPKLAARFGIEKAIPEA
jgi:transcriptional regulator with XRE-family HTH domain